MFALKFKRGASFLFSGPVNINGAVQSMVGWQISSAIRQWVSNGTVEGGVGLFIASLPCSWTDAANAVAQIGDISVNTAAWPIGPAVVDIQLTSPTGVVIVTDSQKIEIIARVTSP